MDESKEGYQPTKEDISKAEDMMRGPDITDQFMRSDSKQREKDYNYETSSSEEQEKHQISLAEDFIKFSHEHDYAVKPSHLRGWAKGFGEEGSLSNYSGKYIKFPKMAELLIAEANRWEQEDK